MSKYRRILDACVYKGLLDGSLVRSTRRTVQDKNIHQIIVKNGNVNSDPQIDNVPLTHSSSGFLVGIINYLPGDPGIHTNHAVSAILTNGKLYCFNAHGSDSQSMVWLAHFLIARGLPVNDFLQYSGPNLQALDTQGACTAFSARFLKLHPNVSMTQDSFNDYVVRELTKYSLPELYKYLNTVASVRNVGSSSNSNNRNNRNRSRNANAPTNFMNINRRKVRAKRPNAMNIN